MKFAIVASLAALGALAAPAAPAGDRKRYVPSTHVDPSSAPQKRDVPAIEIERSPKDRRYVPSVHVSGAPKAE